MYILTIRILPIFENSLESSDLNKFTAILEVSMRGPHGFLSASNWPLFPVIYFNCINVNISF